MTLPIGRRFHLYIRPSGIFDISQTFLGLLMLRDLILGLVICKQVRGYISKATGRFLMLSLVATGALLIKSV
ncbi:MAG: hypothetical protein WBB25_21780 [Sulfitobacter sp.]